VVAVAAYFPLLPLPSAESLLDRRWPEDVTALLVQHIVEPLQERGYRDSMPRLTRIDEGVSTSVRQQYEENPYPRWMKLPPPGKALSMEAYLQRRFPHAPRQSLPQGSGVDVLVAGCGTGREPIELARQFEGARVLAVDLSLSSLCYARRKSVELGLDIEYAQADIMNMGSIGRTFDFISSTGVLHHLADPVAGLRGLLPLLRPGGLMLLGLYSELARRNIVAARKFIAERGYAPNAADIRGCRQELMSLEEGAALRQVTSFSDFHGASECRDLLFHVQEERFTLPRIKEVLARFGLTLVGLLVDAGVMAKYRAKYPNDPAGTDLDRWDDFEAAFPDTFAGMYVLLVRKPLSA
jgi:SAM-dependent methyltransferase